METVAIRLGALVVIAGPPHTSVPVLAIDYHRIPRKPGGQPPERLMRTAVGEELVVGKYPHKRPRSDGSSEVIGPKGAASLSIRLAQVVDAHPAYSGASFIAAVPGRRHTFSNELGEQVCNLVRKELVRLSWEGDRVVVDDPSRLTDETIIVIDDVYRTGRTLRAAAAALRSVRPDAVVIGLTLICTASAVCDRCGCDEDP